MLRVWVVEIDVFFFLMIRRPPRSTQSRSSAASDVYKRQGRDRADHPGERSGEARAPSGGAGSGDRARPLSHLSLIHISEPTRPY